MFQPVIPASGGTGWRFLQTTYDRQLAAFSESALVRADRQYFESKMAGPVALDDFLSDKRLLRIGLTAFGLQGEEWKRGFLKKVLSEAADPSSSFLARLNNPKYTAFAEAFRPRAGNIVMGSATRADITARYTRETFEVAVGDIDESMRLALNYRSEIASLANPGSSEAAIAFRLLADVPVRTVLQRALALPESISRLSVDRQASLLREALRDRLGVSDLRQLSREQNVAKVIDRFHALSGLNAPNSGSTADIRLQLLAGTTALGPAASQNLFLSRL